MLYEIKLKATKQSEKGKPIEVLEQYAVEAQTHGEAESVGMQLYENVDVFSVYRSNISEVYNEKIENEHYYKAAFVKEIPDGKGNMRKEYYCILICAPDLASATALAQYRNSSGEMQLEGVKRVNIIDYLHFSQDNK